MKLLVVDDHSLIREAVRHVVQALAASVTVLSAADCDEGFTIAERESGASGSGGELELLLLDFNLRGGLTGVPAIKAWRQRHPALPVVVLSSVDDRATVLAAMAAGAAGFIPKASSNELMVSALRLVLAGGKYLPAEVLARGDGAPGRAVEAATVESLGLSPRQLEVLELIARGKPNKIICDELGLAERTVKAHVTEVLRALGVSSRTQAALAAARLGLGVAQPAPQR
jgi:DNA-binding NarL/FixJ family response regulator